VRCPIRTRSSTPFCASRRTVRSLAASRSATWRGVSRCGRSGLLVVDTGRVSAIPTERAPWRPSPPRAGRDVPTNPLQARRAELITHYDRHGHPERARYIERQDHLGLVYRRFELSHLAGDDLRRAQLSWARDMFAYWTGWPADSLEDLATPFCALQDLTERASRIEHDPRASEDARARSRTHVENVRGICRPVAESIAAVGLWARVDSYLTPTSLTTADALGYKIVTKLREACASSAPLRVASPGPEGPARYVLVCERCSLVHTSTRVASRCRYCAKSRPRPDGALRMAVTHPELPWLVTGDRVAYVRRCAECGKTFTPSRASAQTCSPRCRVAQSRRLLSGVVGREAD
jgi:hypothetical protein